MTETFNIQRCACAECDDAPMPIDALDICPAKGCPNPIPPGHFACPDDWANVYPHTRRRIAETIGDATNGAFKLASTQAVSQMNTARETLANSP